LPRTSMHDPYRKRAAILSALACPARLHILDVLAGGEAGVGDLAAAVGLEISTVSRHLSILRNSGLLNDRKEGTRVLNTIAAPCVIDFLGCIEGVVSGKVCSIEAVPGKGGTR
jgi:DNA-binding transcriptional ArsR family regulator